MQLKFQIESEKRQSEKVIKSLETKVVNISSQFKQLLHEFESQKNAVIPDFDNKDKLYEKIQSLGLNLALSNY